MRRIWNENLSVDVVVDACCVFAFVGDTTFIKFVFFFLLELALYYDGGGIHMKSKNTYGNRIYSIHKF